MHPQNSILKGLDLSLEDGRDSLDGSGLDDGQRLGESTGGGGR